MLNNIVNMLQKTGSKYNLSVSKSVETVFWIDHDGLVTTFFGGKVHHARTGIIKFYSLPILLGLSQNIYFLYL
jgi:hypothetical protein